MQSRDFESNDDGMEETFELEASIRSIEDVDWKFDSNEEDDSSSRELTLKSRKDDVKNLTDNATVFCNKKNNLGIVFSLFFFMFLLFYS